MAWPSYVVSGQVALANQYNALVDAHATWGGGVDAGGYAIRNLAGITLVTNSVLDVSAGGFQIHGATVVSATDAAPLTVLNGSTGVSLQLYTGGGAANPQLHSSTGLVLITSQDTTITRGIVLNAASGKQESITTTSGRLTIPALDVTGMTASTITSGTLSVTGSASIANLTVAGGMNVNGGVGITGNLSVSGGVGIGGDCNITGTLGTGRPDGYLYIAPWVRASQIFASVGVSAASTDWTKYVSLTWGGDNNPYITCNNAASTLIISPNTQVTGWLRTVGASGLYVYSPDLSRYLQIFSSNAGNPVIQTSTSSLQISANMVFTGVASFAGSVTVSPGNISASGQIAAGGRLTAGQDVTISASATGSGYLQLCNNGQFGYPNPWLYSSTGWIEFNSSVAFRNTGWAVYNASGAYLSTAWSGANPALGSSTGLLQINGSLTVTGSGTVTGAWTVNGNIGVGAGSTVYVYNPANSQYATIGFGGAQPGIGSTTGVFQFTCGISVSGASSFGSYTDAVGPAGQFRALSTAPILWYNAANSLYGVLNFGGAHPNIGTSTGTLTIGGNMIVTTATAASGITINMPAAADSNIALGMAGQAGIGVIIGVSNTINGGYRGYISSPGQLNVSSPLLYVTGAVSATAHQTHGSGEGIADIRRAFHRGVERTNEHVVSVNAWTLAPSDDGLHILVKRSETQVSEFILPWSDARDV